MSWLRKHWQKLILVLFWMMLITAYIIYASINKLSPLQTLRSLVSFLSEHPLGPLIFIAIYTLRPLVLFSASLLTLAGGALFGPIWGTLYTLIGSNLGASLAYVLGRFLGKDTLSATGGKGLQGYFDRMRHNSFETIFFMRLIFLPYDLVNYAAGFLKIRYVPFILATILGSLPGTISFVLFGASSGLDKGTPRFDWRILLISVVIFVLSLLLSRWLKGREKTSHAS
jgi:uncharacterized membrane protein YdjX (TVP38/TMEM64 family)